MSNIEEVKAKIEKYGFEVGHPITNGKESGVRYIHPETKAYFDFYPDGTYTRDSALREDYEGPTNYALYLVRAEKEREARERAREREERFIEPIRLSEKEFRTLCQSQGITFGRIADFYPEEFAGYKARGTAFSNGVEIAVATYAVYTFNEDSEGEEEIHDPFYIRLARDSRNPEKILARQID